ncbi:hypothetical protein LTR78_005614 [Recurvomyces mirabilis]|uniref:Uncharacterized protein n=1 Tax=Recurvomyces mirabilis TaxID=574656 RepID=A0AAE0WMH0_9PEZI|nr:hypothetical protein LTR78_005614 [Recurvomyces mirabilis]KAK5151265.1 hypothetical protein LTS14_009435 [Recurvomyces mirabilis]
MVQNLARPFFRSSRGKNVDEDEPGESYCLPTFTRPQPSPGNLRRVPTLQELERECRIQPHTDEGGDAYYIGDFYDKGKCAAEWRLPDLSTRPYLKYVKEVSQSFPHVEYLAHWMEVSCAPPKWKFVKKHPTNRDERAQRCSVCVLDYVDDVLVKKSNFNTNAGLQEFLGQPTLVGTKPPIRLIIVEDLSRDVVELLGHEYDVDPLFFMSHIGDYLFHNTRDPWVELPDLDIDARRRTHFNLSYLRARYFKTDPEFKTAEGESGDFNVLRRLDSDRSRARLQDSLLDVKGASVTLSRSKTSLWVQPREKEAPITALLLVDPTVKAGYPLWGGNRPFENTPSSRKPLPEPPTRTSLFDDVIYWSSKFDAEDLEQIRKDPNCIAIPMFRLVLASWRTVLKYMASMLCKIEWEFERPHWGETPSQIDASLRKLSPWARNIPSYQAMISESIDRVFRVPPEDRNELTPEAAHHPRPDRGLQSLLHDFRLVQQLMNASQRRIETIQTFASNRINIEESRRAIQQNQSLARLTLLATVFIPLNFTSSFLSMSPGFNQATETIWMFFTIGIPLTILALIGVDLSNPGGLIRTVWRKHKGTGNALPSPDNTQQVPIGTTINWMATRSETWFGRHAR